MGCAQGLATSISTNLHSDQPPSWEKMAMGRAAGRQVCISGQVRIPGAHTLTGTAPGCSRSQGTAVPHGLRIEREMVGSLLELGAPVVRVDGEGHCEGKVRSV